MIILAIEFLAIIVICYLFLVFVTSNRVSEGERKPIPVWVVGVGILMIIAMILFVSWYGRLTLGS